MLSTSKTCEQTQGSDSGYVVHVWIMIFNVCVCACVRACVLIGCLDCKISNLKEIEVMRRKFNNNKHNE